MYDLSKEVEQLRLLRFATDLFSAIQHRVSVSRRHLPTVWPEFVYRSSEPTATTGMRGKKVLVISDAESPDSNLAQMVARLQACFQEPISVINLHEVCIRAGCLGCIQCGLDNRCVFHGADGQASGKGR